MKILGTPIKSIIESEDRKLFAEKILEIDEKVEIFITLSKILYYRQLLANLIIFILLTINRVREY